MESGGAAALALQHSQAALSKGSPVGPKRNLPAVCSVISTAGRVVGAVRAVGVEKGVMTSIGDLYIVDYCCQADILAKFQLSFGPILAKAGFSWYDISGKLRSSDAGFQARPCCWP